MNRIVKSSTTSERITNPPERHNEVKANYNPKKRIENAYTQSGRITNMIIRNRTTKFTLSYKISWKTFGNVRQNDYLCIAFINQQIQ